ncbi:MAG: redoxin domain-containing protein [Alphaproteobacteria bacterium]|nr:redoxin domain-containing protein [Alphaproteobacteria bacterium]
MTQLFPGDPVPWFEVPSPVNRAYKFHTVAGRHIVLSFFGTAGDAPGQAFLKAIAERRAAFDDIQASFFGVSVDPADERERGLVNQPPGIRFLFDVDRTASRLYGLTTDTPEQTTAAIPYRRTTFLLDPGLRVLEVLPFTDPVAHADAIVARLATLPRLPPVASAGVQAPVLIVPRVFEPALCHRLIELYEQHGGEASGFMRQIGEKTERINDPGMKRRSDYAIAEPDIREACQRRVARRLIPAIQKAFQFTATRMERYIVARYTAEEVGIFRAHRDNTTKGTAHRRFAVSLNLNSEDYEGGDLRFPEFGTQCYRPPTGGALVFSCSLLHEVLEMRAGKRYVFLPFLYDDAGANIREANNVYLAEDIGRYESGLAEERAQL